MSKETVKAQIDLDITNKTTSKSISPSNVGLNMKAIADLIPEVNIKTNGLVLAINGLKETLQYDINTVNKDGGSEVKLPTTTEINKEVLVLASNYSGTISVYVNDVEDVKLSGGINGISSTQGNLQINANEAYRFISLGNDYWYFEKIIDIPDNYYQLISEKSTDGTLATNSDFKYPTEQAVKTYVDSKTSSVSGTYTPIITASTNISAGSTNRLSVYTQTGKVVSVKADVLITFTTSSIASIFKITLPIGASSSEGTQFVGSAIISSEPYDTGFIQIIGTTEATVFIKPSISGNVRVVMSFTYRTP